MPSRLSFLNHESQTTQKYYYHASTEITHQHCQFRCIRNDYFRDNLHLKQSVQTDFCWINKVCHEWTRLITCHLEMRQKSKVLFSFSITRIFVITSTKITDKHRQFRSESQCLQQIRSVILCIRLNRLPIRSICFKCCAFAVLSWLDCSHRQPKLTLRGKGVMWFTHHRWCAGVALQATVEK